MLLVDTAVVVEVEIDAFVVERRNVIEIFDERVLRNLVLCQLVARDPGSMRADDLPGIVGVQKVTQRQFALAFADRIERRAAFQHQPVGRGRQASARQRDDLGIEVLADFDDVLDVAVRRVEQRGDAGELRTKIAQPCLDLPGEDRGVVAFEPLLDEPLQRDVEVEQLQVDRRPAVRAQIAFHRENAVGHREGRQNGCAGFVEVVVGVEVRRDDEQQFLHGKARAPRPLCSRSGGTMNRRA